MKPRIYMAGGVWWCSDNVHVGCGTTPSAALADWQLARDEARRRAPGWVEPLVAGRDAPLQ